MRGQVSPSTGRRYPLTMICGVLRVPRSSVYAATVPRPGPAAPGKRGPRTRWRDAAIVAEIRAVLAATPFHGEGYRKVRARLEHRGLAVGGKRVLRLMRVHGLLAPRRLGPPNGNPAHTGTIITDQPDVMWGTDATRFYTAQEGWCWFFGAIDHYSDDVVGWHVAKLGDRWAALEPIRQGARYAFGGFAKDLARGLTLRCDWGPQVHCRRLDQRGQVAGDHHLALVCGRARVQRGHRALHPDPEGAVSLPPSVPDPRGGAADHWGVHRPLQPRVAHRAARASHPRASAG